MLAWNFPQKVIDKTRDASANKIFESSCFWLSWIVLSDRGTLCFWSNGLLVKWIVFFRFFLLKLVSYYWDQGTNFSQLILGVDTAIVHKMQVLAKFLVAITRYKICYSWTPTFSDVVRSRISSMAVLIYPFLRSFQSKALFLHSLYWWIYEYAENYKF